MLQRNISFCLSRIDAFGTFMVNGLWGRGPLPATRPRADVCGVSLGGIAAMMLETNSIIVILLIGLIGDVIIGIIGAFIGSWIWSQLHLPGIGPWWLTAIVIATVGACILLFIIRLIKRSRR